jgi:hypothetical protein
MLHKLSDHIRACYDRAAAAAEQAAKATDAALKSDLLNMEQAWTHLAKSYEFVQSLESFLLDAHQRRLDRE